MEITEQGRSGTAWWRRPNRFRLTYKPTKDAGPTDNWRRIKTLEEAKAVARAARLTFVQGAVTVDNADNTGGQDAQLNLPLLAALFTFLNAAVLAIRIRAENRALAASCDTMMPGTP